MAIDELTAVIPPPARPLEAGSEKRWKAIQKELGTKLPSDFREFGVQYGTGKFVNLGIWIFNAFAAAFPQWLDEHSGIWRSLKESEGDEEVPYKIFPNTPGLLVWGADEEGAGMFWLTEGQPDNWPVIVRSRETPTYHRFKLSMTTFMTKVMKREIVLPGVWPEKLFAEPTQLVFKPVEMPPRSPGKSIYQLYVENRNRAGFWIQRHTGLGSDQLTRVLTIAGRSEGPLPEVGPASGSPSVVVSIYQKAAIIADRVDWTEYANYPIFCRVPDPDWWKEKP